MMTHYANCDVINEQNKKFTEISHQQRLIAQKYKRTCVTVVKFFHTIH